MKIPKTLGGCADRLHAIKAEKSEIQRQIEKLDDERHAIEDHLIQNVAKDDATGVLGRVAKAVIKVKSIATVEDWNTFYKWILKKKDFSVLNKAVNQASVRERWEAGEALPGVGKFNKIDVSVTKI